MYSNGQSANFTGHSLHKYRIVFNQTLQHSLIYRYVTHLGRKPSKTVTIKTFRKTLFYTKLENSKGYKPGNFEISENPIIKLDITTGLRRTLPDCVFHEILQNLHIELKYDFNG
ncbi:hypothetical protein T11_8688, partial [Trichinella zimbabwensis]